jgi:hypothetical protein
MPTKAKREGVPSPKYGNLGVYILCSGPDPSGSVPGERVIVVIYDKENKIVRRLEQIKGDCLDEGFVDFFNSFKCRPSVQEYHFIDTDKNGTRTILASHTTPSDAHSWLKQNISIWAREHGISQ